MSATSTSKQIEILQDEFMHGAHCFVLTEGAHRDNLMLQLRRYKRQKQLNSDIDENIHDHEVGDDSKCYNES